MYEDLKKTIIKFREVRDWKQFHHPKNLAEGLTVEAAELLENFLWKSPEESKNLSTEELNNVQEELADIFIYIVYLCEEFNLDLFQITKKKIAINKKKYPVEKAKGNAKKYTEL